jgi:hypothetical protein
VGRHHCWAAGPLGLGFPVSLYIVTPSIINTTIHSPTWYQTRFRVFFAPLSHLQQPPAAQTPAATHVQPSPREGGILPGRLPSSRCPLSSAPRPQQLPLVGASARSSPRTAPPPTSIVGLCRGQPWPSPLRWTRPSRQGSDARSGGSSCTWTVPPQLRPGVAQQGRVPTRALPSAAGARSAQARVQMPGWARRPGWAHVPLQSWERAPPRPPPPSWPWIWACATSPPPLWLHPVRLQHPPMAAAPARHLVAAFTAAAAHLRVAFRRVQVRALVSAFLPSPTAPPRSPGRGRRRHGRVAPCAALAAGSSGEVPPRRGSRLVGLLHPRRWAASSMDPRRRSSSATAPTAAGLSRRRSPLPLLFSLSLPSLAPARSRQGPSPTRTGLGCARTPPLPCSPASWPPLPSCRPGPPLSASPTPLPGLPARPTRHCPPLR